MRKFVLLVLLLPFLLLLVVAIALLPAHLQIRAIAPPLPDWAAIDSALSASPGPSAASFINTASQTSPLGTLGHPAVLFEWPGGDRFLLDTGMPPAEAVAFGEPMELLLDAEPTRTHGSPAQLLGAAVQSVRGVAFTHLHSDHTDGLPGICGAQQSPATVYQAPLQFDERNHTTDMGYEALARASCPIEKLADALLMPLPGFPGLYAVSLGGHTPGSTAYLARIDGHTWIFSGDITNDKLSLDEDLPKPFLYSTLIVPEDTERTALLRQWLAALDARDDTTVLPAHDVQVMAAVLPAFSSAGP